MIEVESNFSVSNLNEIRKIAKTLGKCIGTQIKVDNYYTVRSLDSYPKESLRIRKVDGFYVTNFKHKISYVKGVYAKEEIENKIKNLSGFLKLMKELKFKKWMKKEKMCEIYRIKNNFHIELNKVKGLGLFVEVEYLVGNKSQIAKAREEVIKISEKLGFSERDAIKSGYTKMIWNKRDR